METSRTRFPDMRDCTTNPVVRAESRPTARTVRVAQETISPRDREAEMSRQIASRRRSFAVK